MQFFLDLYNPSIFNFGFNSDSDLISTHRTPIAYRLWELKFCFLAHTNSD